MTYRTASFLHDGRRLVYDVYDAPHAAGPLLVYTHGLLIDSGVNRGIADALAARGHRVVLLDLLGHGRSEAPLHAAEYRIDTYAQQVFGLLDELGEGAAVLGGMSLGANVSLFAASQRPERVRGLVLEMPVLEWAVPVAAMIFAPMLLLAHYGRRVVSVVSRELRRLPSTGSTAIDSLVGGASMPPEQLAAVLHGVLVGPVAPTVDLRSGIDVPTLILAHRYDLIHPFDDADRLARQLPNAALVRARSPLELRLRPGRLTAEIASFLDRIEEASPPDLADATAGESCAS